MDVEIRIPKITKKQRYRANTDHNDPFEYYRIHVHTLLKKNYSKILFWIWYAWMPDEEILDISQKYELGLPSSIEILRGEGRTVFKEIVMEEISL